MRKDEIRQLAVGGMLIALEVVLAFTPAGYLKIGLLSITFMTVPVIVGAITEGPGMGTLLGAVFGFTSLIQCFGMDPFGTALFQLNPFGTVVTCVLARLLTGFLCAAVYMGLKQTNAPAGVRTGVAAFSAPFFNTVLFMGSLLAFFWRTEYIQSIAAGADIFKFLLVTVGVNGVVEWIVCTAVGAAVSLGLLRALRRS